MELALKGQCFALSSAGKGFWYTGFPSSFTRRLCHADEPQQLSINCEKLIRKVLVFVPHMLAFQILPRIYLCCGRVEENVSVKKTHKNVWTFKWCRVWITANNLKSKMDTCLSCTALYRYWMVCHHGHILAKQAAYFKALDRDTSIFSSIEGTCDDKRRKMPCYNLHRRWNLSIKVRDWDLLLVSL